MNVTLSLLRLGHAGFALASGWIGLFCVYHGFWLGGVAQAIAFALNMDCLLHPERGLKS